MDSYMPPTSMPTVPTTPMEMLNRAVMSGATPETLEKLLALQERWEQNQARKAFDTAIAAARAKIPPIKKNRTVSYGAGKTDDLPLRERYLPDLAAVTSLNRRLCAGGAVALFAAARPGSRPLAGG